MTNYDIIGDWRIRINGNEHGVPHVHMMFKGFRFHHNARVAHGQSNPGEASRARSGRQRNE